MHRRSAGARGLSIIEMAFAIIILGAMFLLALKGTVLISSMRAFLAERQIDAYQTAMLHYQTDYRWLPGDDPTAVTRWDRSDAVFIYSDRAVVSFAGDGRINGLLDDSANANGEQYMAWRDLRLGGYISGDVSLVGRSAMPDNPFGGVYGFAEDNLGLQQVLCLTRVPGRDAELLDKRIDDGNVSTGRVRGTSQWDPVEAMNHFTQPDSAPYDPEKTYIICTPYMP